MYFTNTVMNSPDTKHALVDLSHTFLEMKPGTQKKKVYDFAISDYKNGRDKSSEEL